MSKPLVIVESPAKAKTIGQILGGDYIVESSVGHIRDLPSGADEIPAAYRDEPWARIAVNVEADFKPIYVVPARQKQQVRKLKALLKEASALFLATDEDREGESIAWHLSEVLGPQVPVQRMVFHEITRPAIEHAVANPRDLDRRLVDAQEARRILDRLYGYELSPVLWRRVLPRLSAGRVQSVATRLIVERERERIAFRSAAYWDIEATFETPEGSFVARLDRLDGRRLASGRDFDASGALAGDAVVLDEAQAGALVAALGGATFTVRSVEEKPWRRSPQAPFMTSTLQQEAGRKLRFQAGRTMRIAQRLYENGYITYMRTDSVTLSETAIAAARSQAREMYGADSVPGSPRVYASKVKNAQEAHEAIRPAGDTFRTPDQVRGELSDEEHRLYDLVWKRTIASQMADARGQSVQVRVGATPDGRDAEFGASGKTITFPGFLRAYVEGSDDPDAELEDQERLLPPLAEGDTPNAIALEPKAHETQPPARFTEASLVKALEEMGIGRPSTYASIIDTIEDRGYVFKKGSALVPSVTAFVVTQLLEAHFTHLVDYTFTARMEDELDQIASGDQEAIPYLRRFYHGNGEPGLHTLVDTGLEEIDAREINAVPIGAGPDGVAIEARPGRYGPYLRAGERTASIPEDLPLDELTVDKALELLDAPSDDRTLGSDPESGLPVLLRNGRFGPYVQLGEAAEDGEKPKTASLFKSMTVEAVTLEDALRLLTLPRVIGEHPEGGPVEARNGRYGPYISWGKENRTLEAEEQLFSLSLDQAVELLKQPKRRRGQRAAAPPLKELGPDPVSGGAVVVKDGRYGPYVTDGETNASLRKGDDVETITIERAAELLQIRRETAPKRAKRAKKSAKKPAAKKTAAKKKPAAKKTAKKKPAAKKAATKKAVTKKAVTNSPASAGDEPPPVEIEPERDEDD